MLFAICNINALMWLKTSVLCDFPVVSGVVRLNTSISYGKRTFFHVYTLCAFLKPMHSMYIIVSNVYCI
jgi:hypothetical protein